MGGLVLIAGLELFVNTSIAGLSGIQVAGLLFVLSGLVKVVHAFGMCSACKDCCTMPLQSNSKKK